MSSHSINGAQIYEHLTPFAPQLRRHLERQTPRWLTCVISVEDLLQNVWIEAIASLGNPGMELQQLKWPWLRTIADNTLLDVLRTAQRVKRGGRHKIRHSGSFGGFSGDGELFARISGATRTPSREVASREATFAIHHALASLPTDQRTAIRLRFVERLSLREVSVRMDKSPVAVNGLLFRGVRSLRQILTDPSKFFSDVGNANAAARRMN